MSEHARVVKVDDKVAGDELAADAAAGATSITVEDLVDFNDGTTGGWLVINDQVIRYTAGDDETGVLTLATGLTAAAVTGDRVDVWDTTTASPSVDRVAWVAFDGMEDGDALDYVVRHDLIDYLPVEDSTGARASGVGESVEIDDDLVVHIFGKVPTIDLRNANPDTMPEGGPVELPAVSPTPTGKIGPASAILTWAATVGLRYEVHVSDTNGTAAVAGDPATLHSEVAGPDVWIYTLADGTTKLSTETDAYAALIAYNSAGELAPPSPWVPIRAGSIPPEFMQVLAGEVIAQAMNTDAFRANTIHGVSLDVAGILMNVIDGLFVPSTTAGKPRFQVPIDPADPIQILAFVEALGAIFQGNVTIRGLTNFLHGLLTLGNGVSDPSTPPIVSGEWDNTATALASDSIVAPSQCRGLVERIGSSGQWIVARDFISSSDLRSVNKTTGVLDPFIFPSYTDFHVTGITAIGTSYYMIGTDASRSGDWYVYRLNSSFVKTGESRLFGSTSLNKWPAIGNDGTNVLVAYTSATGAILRLRTYAVSEFSTLPDNTDATVTGSVIDLPVSGTPYNITGVHKGTFYGATNHIISTQSGPMFVFNSSNVRQTSLEMPRANNTSKVNGLQYDGTRFRSLDDAGNVWDYSLHDGASKAYTYTWHDDDAGGSGTAESKPSPARTFTVPRGARPVISTPAPDDDGTADAPNAVRVYAANVRQATYTSTPLELSRSFDSLAPTGTAAPTTSGFAGRPATAPGAIATAKLAALDGNPLTQFKGDGSGRFLKIVQAGQVNSGTMVANTDKTIAVTFPEAFDTSNLAIQLTVRAGGSVELFNVGVNNVTTTGFDLIAKRTTGTGAFNVDWTATVRS